MPGFIQHFFKELRSYHRMLKTLKGLANFGFDKRLAWREMRKNYQVRKSHPVRIISLGYDCMVRTILTNWMLKPDRRSGEKGMVFDRAKHTSKMIADLLEKDFANYFENWKFNPAPELNCWFNFSQISSAIPFPVKFREAMEHDEYQFYPHDKDCGPDDLEKIRERTKRRLVLFLDTLTHPQENDLYILHKRVGESTADIERLCRLIRTKRGLPSAHILVFVTNLHDKTEKIEGADMIRGLYPYENSSWGEHKIHKRLHIFFAMKIAKICRQYILDSFPAA